MLDFMKNLDKTPKTIIIVLFIVVIILVLFLILVSIYGPFCKKTSTLDKYECPACNCAPCPQCPDCNCAPCQVCKKCRKCKGDKSPCDTQSMTDCAFDPESYFDSCVEQLSEKTQDGIKNCQWLSSLYLIEGDKESCKSKCIEMCPLNGLISYDCPVYCENECCNYDYNCR